MRRALFGSILGVLLLPASATAATSTIDFNSISSPVSPTGEGLVVDQVTHGNGISGDPVSGFVGVFGDSQDPAITTNAALVFDATCTVDGAGGVCSGGDQDLFKPELGNVLIVAEDLVDANGNGRIDDPDDADLQGQTLDFALSSLGTGKFRIVSLDALDFESIEPSRIEIYDNGALVKTVTIPAQANNELSTIAIDAVGDRILVVMGGSGAVDNIRLETIEEPPPPGGEGCTPGFWKNHPEDWGSTGYAPNNSFNTVFGVSYKNGLSLLDALKLGGGGFAKLARHGTAALLNAAHGDVDYGLTAAQVIAAVQAAFASGSPEPTATELAARNERGCDVE